MFLQGVRVHTLTSIRRLAARCRREPSVKLLRDKTGYVFTDDYVSRRIDLWNKYAEGFKGKDNVTMLEIGSFEGRSCIWFLENILTHPTSSITCVDIFSEKKNYEQLFDHNVGVSGLGDKVRKLKGTSESILPNLGECTFDIIYVDGSHDAANVLMDAVSGWVLLKPGGIMIFDDYEWEPDKLPEHRPQPAIDLFLKVFRNRLEVLHKGYQVIINKPVEAAGLTKE